MTDKCNLILEEDTLETLRRLNQRQRRAVKVDPGNRCGVCARPIFMNPGLNKHNHTTGNMQFGADVQIWGHSGLQVAAGSVVVFSSRQAFHRPCFNVLHTQTILAGGHGGSISAPAVS